MVTGEKIPVMWIMERFTKAALPYWQRQRQEAMRETMRCAGFLSENEQWLDNYALYMACKKHFGMKAWSEWEDKDIRMHRPEAVEKYRRDLQEDMELFIYIQYLFFKQWNALRAYINDLGIEITGICRSMYPWILRMCGQNRSILF